MDKKNIPETFSNLGLPQNFCLVPFTTLILEPDGNVGVCRHKGCDFPVGNLKEQTLDEIWNGKKIIEWRKEFLSGNVKICHDEVRYRKCHLCPEYNKLLEHTSFTEFQNGPILRLGANFNGKCNLKCIMCNVREKPNGFYDNPKFWSMLEKEILPHLKEIDLLSGEPFIQRDTYKLIEITSRVNPSCQWTLTTNAHWKFNKFVREHLDKIQIKNIIISIDAATEKTYSKIRVGGTFSKVIKTIEDIINYNDTRTKQGKKEFGPRLNFLTQKDNWQELGMFLSLSKEKNIRPFVTYLYEPAKFSLATFNQAKRREVLDFYIKTLSKNELKLSMRVIMPLIDTFETKIKKLYLHDLLLI